MSLPDPAAPRPAHNWRQWQSLAMIAVFDIAGPLVAYSQLRSAGMSTVSALVLSGVFPAFGVALGFAWHRRIDALGVLVLIGIVVGTVLGLASGSARLVLVEGSVPTGVFGLVCLGSLFTSRPLMFRFAHQFMGEDTPKGRDFVTYWQHAGFRRIFIVMTVVWGVAYLLEAAARVVVVETTSTATALTVSKVMPYVVAGVLVGWMVAYGQLAKRKGERPAAAARAGATVPQPGTDQASTEGARDAAPEGAGNVG